MQLKSSEKKVKILLNELKILQYFGNVSYSFGNVSHNLEGPDVFIKVVNVINHTGL